MRPGKLPFTGRKREPVEETLRHSSSGLALASDRRRYEAVRSVYQKRCLAVCAANSGPCAPGSRMEVNEICDLASHERAVYELLEHISHEDGRPNGSVIGSSTAGM